MKSNTISVKNHLPTDCCQILIKPVREENIDNGLETIFKKRKYFRQAFNQFQLNKSLTLLTIYENYENNPQVTPEGVEFEINKTI